MSIEVKVPVLPESVADATIAAWHKKPGDSVSRNENLVDIETDKVVLEVPAPDNGILKEIRHETGSTVTANQVIAVLETGAVTVKSSAKPGSGNGESIPDSKHTDESTLSPAVRKLVAEHELDPAQITGSGRNGRIMKEDVLKMIEADTGADNKKAAVKIKQPIEAKPAKTEKLPAVAGERAEQRVPMTRLRARVAERLLQAQANAAILTTFNEVDMQPVMELRTKYRDSFEKKHAVKLGFMSFFVKAAVEALKRFPEVNASIDGNDIVYHGYCDVGVAVSSPRGLVVPILRNAEHMSMADIEQKIIDFGSSAKDGTLSLDDMTGGTFTISNGGVFGSLLSTPILNPPQSGILGMHKIEPRAVVVNGAVVVRPMMYLALSYDHRIVDGREAVQFLVAIKDQLEDPARILLEI
ncbi:MAG: 2-oxoglutarate dehydrogenase complex dihydrolipoyllysine-residue succinyltransferase [Gammaproteobacteria bacterium]|nr:2-oxoglutarate dehydrogenase complex dihydrolipoyllysine-residue succinyltransferase [Gammaproteobacteria bacterium]